MLMAPGILPVSMSSWGSRTSFGFPKHRIVSLEHYSKHRGIGIERIVDVPTMTTFSLGSFFSTNALISSKLQMRLPGTWLSGPAEYHRTPAAPTLLLHLVAGNGRVVAAAETTLENVLVAARAEVIVAGVEAAAMRRSGSRWQTCLVAIASCCDLRRKRRMKGIGVGARCCRSKSCCEERKRGREMQCAQQLIG